MKVQKGGGGGARVDANLMILFVAYSEQITYSVSTNGNEFLVFKCDKCKPRGKFRGWVSRCAERHACRKSLRFSLRITNMKVIR